MYDLLVLSETTLSSCQVVTFPACVLHALMYGLLASSEITLSSCLVFTFPACVLLASCTACWCWVIALSVNDWYSHSLHGYFCYRLLVLSENTLSSCHVVTFPAWVLLALMYGLLVLREITLSSCMVIAFPACVFLAFMYQLLELSESTLCKYLVFTFPA